MNESGQSTVSTVQTQGDDVNASNKMRGSISLSDTLNIERRALSLSKFRLVLGLEHGGGGDGSVYVERYRLQDV
jgi:hypothetical protein